MRGAQTQLLTQTGLAAIVIIIMTLAPPARGAMLALPIGANAASVLLNREIRLRGQGPIPGSLIIDARGRNPFWFALSRGVLLLNAEAATCGTNSSKRKAF
ncbi:MAG: hypothetical protein C0474_05275 [Sphingobium sp.]|nr:hypothetical protein [Sphingobium sp.]